MLASDRISIAPAPRRRDDHHPMTAVPSDDAPASDAQRTMAAAG